MEKSLLGAMLGFVLVVSPAVAQDKKSPAGGNKAATQKTDDAKAADAKAGDAKAGDAKESAKVNEKTAAFDKLRRELGDTIKDLEDIQSKYRQVKPEGRPALEEEFEVKKAQAKKLLPQVTAAAEAAIAVDPTDPEVMDHIGALARGAERRSAYEEAARFAQLVLDHQPAGTKLRRPELFRIGGVSAFYAAQFDTAEKYLKELEKNEYSGQDLPPAPECRAQLKQERAHWQEELARQKAEKKPEGDPQALPRVKLATTQGDIVVELFENEAPNTVANFIKLVEKKFYDGQPLGSSRSDVSTGAADPNDQEMAYKIACECTRPDFRRHFRGSLAMWIPEGKDTGSSQFSIWLQPIRDRDPTVHENKEITGGATVFGRVVSGMEVLSKVRQAVETGSSLQPNKVVQATVLNKRSHKYEVKKIAEKAKPEAPPKTGTTPEGKTEPATKTPEKTTPEKGAVEKAAPAKTPGSADGEKTSSKKPDEKGK